MISCPIPLAIPGFARASSCGLLLLAMALLVACGGNRATVRTPTGERVTFKRVGEASWYGPGFAGRRTANGEVFDPMGLTAAHENIPFNRRVRVTNLETGDSVVVRVNDRFPGTKGRVIDLSQASFAAIAPLDRGLVPVSLEVLDQ